ncbi:MAG: hypothetical protein WC956_05610 [bacterium]
MTWVRQFPVHTGHLMGLQTAVGGSDMGLSAETGDSEVADTDASVSSSTMAVGVVDRSPAPDTIQQTADPGDAFQAASLHNAAVQPVTGLTTGGAENARLRINRFAARADVGALHSPQIELQFGKGITIEEWRKTVDSYFISHEGRFVNPELLRTMGCKDLMRHIREASDAIAAQPGISSFEGGGLNSDKAKNAEVLAWQYFHLWNRLADLAESAGEIDLESMLSYISDTSAPQKPFSKIVSSALLIALGTNREVLYEVLEKRRLPLSEAMKLIDVLPHVPQQMLAQVPSVRDLQLYLEQSDKQPERHIVVDDRGRAFLVRGLTPMEGKTIYRDFNDLVADVHTHSRDWPFSTGDISLIKHMEDAKSVYDISNDVDFYVRSPGGIFAYRVKKYGEISALIDSRKDAYLMPCTVRYTTDGGEMVERSFEHYTNHLNGEAGRFIASAISQGVRELTIRFEDGDQIEYHPWNSLGNGRKLDVPFIRLENFRRSK